MGIPNTLIKTCTRAGAHTHKHTQRGRYIQAIWKKRRRRDIRAHACTRERARVKRHGRKCQDRKARTSTTAISHLSGDISGTCALSRSRLYAWGGTTRLISSLRFSSFTLRPRRFIYRDIYSWKDEREARTLDKATKFMSKLFFGSLRLRKLGLKTNDAYNFYLS